MELARELVLFLELKDIHLSYHRDSAHQIQEIEDLRLANRLAWSTILKEEVLTSSRLEEMTSFKEDPREPCSPKI